MIYLIKDIQWYILLFKIYKELIEVNIRKTKKPKPPPDPNSIKKWVEDLNRYFFQRRHTDGQQTHEKMPNIINHQGKSNQYHNEISLHTCQNGW